MTHEPISKLSPLNALVIHLAHGTSEKSTSYNKNRCIKGNILILAYNVDQVNISSAFGIEVSNKYEHRSK